MTIAADNMPDVVIVGGGIAGLSAAWYAQQAGLSYTIVEAGNRWGGKVHTEIIDIGHSEPLRIEYAPDGFITRKPGMTDLVRSLGMEDALIPVNNTLERIYVLSRGRLHPLPDGLQLLAPTMILPFLRSGLFTWPGKIRMLAERFIPPKRDDKDESLADFITRRFGQEALQKLGEPLLAGVYNADPHKQSMLATFGSFRKIEAENGSLIRGLQRLAKSQKDTSPALIAFREGMGGLVDAITKRLTGELCLNTLAERIARTNDQYVVHTSAGVLYTRHVIMATPAGVASQLLQDFAPEASAALGKIRHSSVGSISLAYHEADVLRAMDAYGIVIPSAEKRQIDGITWTSAKWQNRAPNGVALLRVFFGGIHTAHMLDLPDDARLQIIREELRAIMGIEAEPIAHHGKVWHDAYPQYEVGHAEQVRAIESGLPAGLYVTGNSYHGIGLPDTVSTSQRIIHTICEEQYANVKV